MICKELSTLIIADELDGIFRGYFVFRPLQQRVDLSHKRSACLYLSDQMNIGISAPMDSTATPLKDGFYMSAAVARG